MTPPTGESRVRRTLRFLQRPRVSLIFLILALVDLFTLAPGFKYEQSGSTVANAIGSLREPEYRQLAPPPRKPSVYFAWFAQGDRYVVISGRNDERAQGADCTFDVYGMYRSMYSGFWGLTTETRGFGWAREDAGAKPWTSPRGQAGIAAAYQEFLEANGDPFWVNEFRLAQSGGGSYTAKHIHWPGVLRNAASLTNGALLIVSLGWIGSERRLRARWRRLAKGECPWCRYGVPGIPTDSPCPECGRRLAPPPLPAEPARFRRRAPFVSAALLAVLLLDTALLPHQASEKPSPPIIGSWVGNHLPWSLRTDRADGRPVDRLDVFAIPTPDGVEFALTPAAPPHTSIQCVRDAYTRGFWAPVALYVYRGMGGTNWEVLSEPVKKNIHNRVAEFLDAQGRPEWAADIRIVGAPTYGYVRTTLWLGHAHNAAAMTVAGLFLYSLRWKRRPRAATAAWRWSIRRRGIWG